MPFTLISPAFANGQPIPAAYTCDGGNISPPLVWRDPPPGAQSFVLVIEDPDASAGVFRHWGLYDIPAAQTSLPRGARLAASATVINDFGRAGYDGPCPPPHAVHHYHFHIAALSRATLDVTPRATVAVLWQAAQPYVIGEAELVGTYAH